MNEFQKPEEAEIDLIDLIYYCFRHWRPALVCIFIGALLLGCWQYLSVSSDNAAAAAAAGEETTEVSVSEDDEDPSDLSSYTTEDLTQTKSGIVAYYAQGIAEKEAYLDELQEYIDTSALMNMDSYEVDTAYLVYYIEAQDEESSVMITDAYQLCTDGDGTLAQALLAADDSLPEADLNYLIDFSDSEDEIVLDDDDGSNALRITTARENLFTITLYAADEEAAWAYAGAAQEVIEDQYETISGTIGEHTLTLLSVNVTQVVNTGIATYQNTIMTRYATTLTELQTLRTNYSTALSDLEDEDEEESGTYTWQNPLKKAVKYAIIGALAGFFLAAVVLCLIYLLGGRLQDVGGFSELYGISMLGRITKMPRKKRLFGAIDRLIERVGEGAYSTMTCEEQIKIAAANLRTAAKNSGMQRIMVAGSLKKEEAQALYELLTAELGDLSLSPYSRIVFQASALEELDGYDGIVFLERQGVSFTRLIDEERSLASARGIRILGAVVA